MNTHQTGKDAADDSPSGVVDLNERTWLPRHARGDAEAFGQLLVAYRALVYTFLYRYGIDAQNRDDLFQEIFLKVHQAAGSYRPSEPLKPWLLSVVLNTVRNFRRDRGRRKHFMTHLKAVSGTESAEHDGPGRTADNPNLEDQMAQAATVQWLEQRISGLPEAQREVLVLATTKGLRMNEIATILNLPENTVKTQLRRARMALAQSLALRENPGAAAGGSSL